MLEIVRVVLAIAVLGPLRLRQPASLLVEADGMRRDPQLAAPAHRSACATSRCSRQDCQSRRGLVSGDLQRGAGAEPARRAAGLRPVRLGISRCARSDARRHRCSARRTKPSNGRHSRISSTVASDWRRTRSWCRRLARAPSPPRPASPSQPGRRAGEVSSSQTVIGGAASTRSVSASGRGVLAPPRSTARRIGAEWQHVHRDLAEDTRTTRPPLPSSMSGREAERLQAGIRQQDVAAQPSAARRARLQQPMGEDRIGARHLVAAGHPVAGHGARVDDELQVEVRHAPA